MKIVVSSDWHPDVVTMGVRRFEEVNTAVHETVEASIEMHADLYLFTGDLCDPDSGTSVFRCVRLAIAAAMRLRAAGISSAWLAGNHCVIEDGSGDTVLSPLRPLQTSSRPELLLFESPGEEVFTTKKGESIRIVALPFTATSHTYDPEAFVRSCSKEKMPTIVAGHLTVPGVTPGEETLDMPRGRDIIFPVAACREVFEDLTMINGHYHRAQVHDGVHIPGALARFTFGEVKSHPGFLVVEV